jgi:predicted nucleic-acid-binding Zn-ribbon protein
MANRITRFSPVHTGTLKTNERFLQEAVIVWGDEFSILEPYVDAHTKIKIRHNICGQVIEKSPHSLLAGHGCPKCKYTEHGRRMARTTEEFKKEVFNAAGNEYTVLGEYYKNNTPIKLKHNSCGHVWNANPSWFLNGSRCPKCMRKKVARKRTLSQTEFVKRVLETELGEYVVIGKYVKCETKIEMHHNTCGRSYYVTPSMFMSGNRCPYCVSSSKSNGEKLISKFLKTNKIIFTMGYKIPECKNINPLPFDFAIFKDKKLIALIEFDGVQHFKPVKAFGGETSFHRQKINDEKKTEFCKSNNIPLCRISYKQIRNMHAKLSTFLFQIDALPASKEVISI